MAAAEDWSRQRGLAYLTLETGAKNGRAREFYRRGGFEEEDVRLTQRLLVNAPEAYTSNP
jgi:ribosomal protein S18 acetylase RimI-like enzyme